MRLGKPFMYIFMPILIFILIYNFGFYRPNRKLDILKPCSHPCMYIFSLRLFVWVRNADACHTWAKDSLPQFCIFPLSKRGFDFENDVKLMRRHSVQILNKLSSLANVDGAKIPTNSLAQKFPFILLPFVAGEWNISVNTAQLLFKRKPRQHFNSFNNLVSFRWLRWGCLAFLSLPLPCLLCYPLLKGVTKGAEYCYQAAMRQGCQCPDHVNRSAPPVTIQPHSSLSSPTDSHKRLLG